MTDSGHSPDEADALAISYAKSDTQYERVIEDPEEKRERLREERRKEREEQYANSWMGA